MKGTFGVLDDQGQGRNVCIGIICVPCLGELEGVEPWRGRVVYCCQLEVGCGLAQDHLERLECGKLGEEVGNVEVERSLEILGEDALLELDHIVVVALLDDDDLRAEGSKGEERVGDRKGEVAPAEGN